MSVPLTPRNIAHVDAELDSDGVFAKQYTQLVGKKVVTVGLRIGEKPGHVVALFGDTVTRGDDGTVSVRRSEEMTAEQWNSLVPVGTPVVAYPGVRPDDFPGVDLTRLDTVTRSRAWELGHGQPVVSVEGYAGGIALTHVDVATGGGV